MKLGTVVFQGKTKKGTTITVRYPVEEDVEKAMDYINTISKEETYITFQGQQLTLEEEQKYMSQFFENIKNDLAVKLFVFNDKEELIGVADIKPQERVANHVGGFGLTIKKAYRGEGIGKLLMEQVLSEAKKLKNIKIIQLEVFGDNKIAFELYKKLGFVEFGKLPEGIKHQDHFDDAIWMYKLNN